MKKVLIIKQMNSQVRLLIHYECDEGENAVAETMLLPEYLYDLLNMICEEQSVEEITTNYIDDYETKKNNTSLKLDKKPYHSSKQFNEDCVICSEKFNKNDIVAELSCNHIYHPNCINEWGCYKSNCPLCKKEIETL